MWKSRDTETVTLRALEVLRKSCSLQPRQGEGAASLPDADWPASPLRETSVALASSKSLLSHR